MTTTSLPAPQASHKGHSRRAFLANPLELGFCGLHNSGKTTLVARLITAFAGRWRIGYLKHGKHFDLDRDGKDSAVARAAGATTVVLAGPDEHALLGHGPLAEFQAPQLLAAADVVFVEGFKNSAFPKLLVVDEAGDILTAFAAGELDPVVAAAGTGPRPAALPAIIPWFDRDDIAGIAAFVADFITARIAARPLCGLVLGGGYSTRMGRDKAALDYHGRPQALHAAELLRGVCGEVFLSTRPGQELAPTLDALPRLDDRFLSYGPLGGILTALSARPEAAWLVLACDLPLVTPATLQALLAGRNACRAATTFISPGDGLPEPVCALYEPKARQFLLQAMALGFDCPRKALIHSPTALITAADPQWLVNVNDPAERDAARARLDAASNAEAAR